MRPWLRRSKSLLAVRTGQRQGDLLRLTWTANDGNNIRLKQSTGGRRVTIPVGRELQTALAIDAKAMTAVTILATMKGTPWTSDGFRTSRGKIVATAKVTGLTFHDIRGTAVTRLALGGCSQAEIATFTGHGFAEQAAILHAHHLSRESRIAESALRKREAQEAGPNVPNQAPNCPKPFLSEHGLTW